MKNLFENRYVKVSIDVEKSMMTHRWTGETENMTNEEFKSIFSDVIIDEVKKYCPKNLLVNLIHLRFVMIPEVQEWIDINVATLYLEIGMQKLAYVMNPDFFTQVSIEQLMDEQSSRYLTTKYFKTEKEALNWIN